MAIGINTEHNENDFSPLSHWNEDLSDLTNNNFDEDSKIKFTDFKHKQYVTFNEINSEIQMLLTKSLPKQELTLRIKPLITEHYRLYQRLVIQEFIDIL